MSALQFIILEFCRMKTTLFNCRLVSKLGLCFCFLIHTCIPCIVHVWKFFVGNFWRDWSPRQLNELAFLADFLKIFIIQREVLLIFWNYFSIFAPWHLLIGITNNDGREFFAMCNLNLSYGCLVSQIMQNHWCICMLCELKWLWDEKGYTLWI